MFNTPTGYPSVADIAAVTDGNRDDFGGNGAWWIVIILLAMFGWGRGGFGGYGDQGALTRGDLCQDMNFSDLENAVRGFNAETASNFRNVDNAICTLGYQTADLVNGVNMNILQGQNALASQIAECCCENRQGQAELKFQMAQDTCAIQNTIQNTTRDIIENQNCNTRQILDTMNNQYIRSLENENQSLKFNASQFAQNAYLVNTLRPTPVPAYTVPNPFTGTGAAAATA